MMKTADTRAIVEQTLQAWSRRDLSSAVRHLAETVVHALNIDSTLAPYVASVVGKAAVERKLGEILAAFDFEAFDITTLSAEGDRARAAVSLCFRHVATGRMLVSTIKFRFTVRQDKIVLIEETHDAEHVEAFLRLIKDDAAGRRA